MEYLEELWKTGEGKSLANDTLSGTQHYLMTRRQFPGAWQLLTTWGRLEVPTRAPPLSRDLVLALAGEALAVGREDFAALVLLAFHCYLRPNEFLKLMPSTVATGSDNTAGVLSLPWTKIGQQRGARETVRIEERLVLFWTRRVLSQRELNEPLLRGSAYSFRQFFSRTLARFGLASHRYMPYSLRRGGATYDFLLHRDIPRCLFRGRWSDLRTGRIYITDGAARLAELSIPPASARLIEAGVQKLHLFSRLAGFR